MTRTKDAEPPTGAGHAYRRRWLAPAALAALVAVAVAVTMATGATTHDTAPSPEARDAIAVRANAQAQVQGHVQGRVQGPVQGPVQARIPAKVASAPVEVPAPTHLDIPAIGVTTPLIRLGLNPDHTVEVPEDPDLAGWFDLGPSPGSPGASVILGHVDSAVGPAVFHGLRLLQAGDEVEVRLSDGTTALFAVTRVRTYPNERFPAQRVYAGSPGVPTLTLVTCGGRYDAAAGGYQSNVVAYTRHVQTTEDGS